MSRLPSSPPARLGQRLRPLAVAFALLGLLLLPVAVRAQTPTPIPDGQLVRAPDGSLYVVHEGKRFAVTAVAASEAAITALPRGEPDPIALVPIFPSAGGPPYQLKGGPGRTLTDPFWLNPGLVILRATHTGTANFITGFVVTNEEEAKTRCSPCPIIGFNAIGVLPGNAVAGNIEQDEAGAFQLRVEASGAWEIVVDQPQPTEPLALPQTFSGVGEYHVTPFFHARGGPLRFTTTFDGERERWANAIVEVLDASGALAFRVDVEPREGSNTETFEQVVPEGDYLLYIHNFFSEIKWTIKVEQ